MSAQCEVCGESYSEGSGIGHPESHCIAVLREGLGYANEALAACRSEAGGKIRLLEAELLNKNTRLVSAVLYLYVIENRQEWQEASPYKCWSRINDEVANMFPPGDELEMAIRWIRENYREVVGTDWLEKQPTPEGADDE